MSPIVLAIIIVAAIGLFAGLVLAVASHFMSVPKNETEVRIRECLPGANCGACGFTGCDGYAKALAETEGTKTNLCVPGADAVAKKIADVLGVEAEDVVEQVAFVKCSGDCVNRKDRHIYEGIESCAAAQMLYGGSGMCTFGCLGLGDCMKVCPQGAICIENGIAHVDTRKCVGCGLCAKTCPNHLIDLFPDVRQVIVCCSNKEKGAVVRSKCSSGCIGCGLCARNCEQGAIEVVNNLAVIDYEKCVNCGKCAEKCPVHAIKFADFSGSHRF
ncbi:MAG: RnfABCDGE type electron transport complex subunit B [Clostridiales bacterium]|nr:RnfABCDGE type electron transport complex subunit B [Clostridiales bacterium]